VLARLPSTELPSDSSSFASSEIDEGRCRDRPLVLLKAVPWESESFRHFGEISSFPNSLDSLPSAFPILPSVSSSCQSGGVLIWHILGSQRGEADLCRVCRSTRSLSTTEESSSSPSEFEAMYHMLLKTSERQIGRGALEMDHRNHLFTALFRTNKPSYVPKPQ
jgi:hypothetical protein